MPTFIPPVRDGNPLDDGTNNPANELMRHYGSWAQGVTVWRDSQGVWHESMTPYMGGATHTVHNQWADGVGPTSTTTGPDEGLATAQVVYLGGHVHTITQQEADDLIAAGYGAGVSP